jgi:hypothetical protein
VRTIKVRASDSAATETTKYNFKITNIFLEKIKNILIEKVLLRKQKTIVIKDVNALADGIGSRNSSRGKADL